MLTLAMELPFPANKTRPWRTKGVRSRGQPASEELRRGDETGAMNDEPATLEELFQQLGPRLYRSAFLLSRNPEQAEALVQATFAASVEAWPRFEHRSSAYTWLYSILLRLARRERDTADGYVPDVELSELPRPGADPAQQVELSEQTSALRECLGELSAEQSEVLVLFYLDSMRYHEIAQAVGVPIGTVKSRLHAAKRALARKLRERGIEL